MRLLRTYKIKSGESITHLGNHHRYYYRVIGVFQCPQCGKKRHQKVSSGLKIKRCSCVGHSYSHGLSKTRVYRLWKKIRERCYNPTAASFKDYGARGVTVCARWRRDPIAFIRWAKTHGWRPSLTIDRKDYKKGYSPSNCRFRTWGENARHTRRTKLSWRKVHVIRNTPRTYGSLIKLANRFGVSTSVISQVRARLTWRE